MFYRFIVSVCQQPGTDSTHITMQMQKRFMAPAPRTLQLDCSAEADKVLLYKVQGNWIKISTISVFEETESASIRCCFLFPRSLEKHSTSSF